MIAAFNSPPIDEDRGDGIQKHQRDDHRGQSRIHGDVIIGEARQILAEHHARYQRGHHGEDDAGQDLQKTAAAGRQPGMQDKQCDDQCCDGDAVAGIEQESFVGLDEKRDVAPRRFQHQRTEHDQERHRQRGDGCDQRVADRFQPQPVPAPRLDHRIGAIERDAQRLDAVRGEVHREHEADGQRIAARRGQHVVDFVGQRIRDLFWPDLQQQPRRLIGEFLGAEKSGQRGQHDQERKQRHQHRQRDVAGDRPAVIGEKRIERIHHDQIDVADLPHISP